MFGPDDFEVQIQQEDPPGIHAEPSIPPAQDEEYGDFIVKHGQNMGGKFLPVNELFGILYIPLNEIGPLEINSYTYASLPKCYTFMDADALNSSGITRLHNHPYLKLQGEGTVIAVIDSGIDYLNPIFRNGDVSRIAYIWDQTIPGNEDEQVPYGKVFTGEEINQALLSENPQEIVPSLDENGHGTAMAAGNFVPTENFSGAAPKATIIVVKLKKAKSYLRKFYQYPPQAPVFQEDDIMLGISFAVKMAQEMGMPVSVCLGLGTNQSAHVGDSELSRYVDYINEDSQVSVSVAAGNEGAAQHHYTAELDYVKNQDTVELRIADKEEGFSMDEAVELVSKTCAYTNHTILAEALETWPLEYLEKAVPAIVPVIRELDRRVRSHVQDESTYIIDKENRVHMAHIDIHYGFSVNGVAYLHTEILKNTELNNFYRLYPEKFNNKTNGITFRRWLLHCNEELAEYLTELIGDGYKKNAGELEKLLKYVDDDTVLNRIMEIKQHNKAKLCRYLKDTQNVEIDENSIFDIQVKRLHEYKRQQMNALYVIYKYLEIKKGNKPKTPITVIFGAKAAPAYVIAKDIIHLILCLQQLIDNDPEVSPYLKVVMVENYNVSKAAKIIPACDISEQISLASKEASGTGNMKFMLNGALTLGTMDGANVEIADLVGKDNIYTFGESSEKVISLYETHGYRAADYYINDAQIKELVDFIISSEVMRIGDVTTLLRLHTELIYKDWFMTLLDLKDYIRVREQMYTDYEDKRKWAKAALTNIAKAGFFSSDRTIEEYNRDIWKVR